MFDFNVETTKETTAFETTAVFDMLIIGGGPGGLNAGLYGIRKGLKVGILTKEIGGQLQNTTTVDNYLGFDNIDGSALSDKFLHHINALEVPLLKGVTVGNITKEADTFHVHVEDGRTFKAKTVIFATGGSPRKLQIPGEDTYNNKGISYCATCDAPFYKDKHVIVAGGGNSAAEGVLDLAAWASKVTVIHRSQWRADHILLEKMKAMPNLEIYLEHQLKRVNGNGKHMTGVEALNKETGEVINVEAEGLLIEIGTIPRSELIQTMVDTNQQGEVIVDAAQMTSVPGLFAIGDVTTQPDKQVIIAAAEGAKAALAATQYINKKI